MLGKTVAHLAWPPVLGEKIVTFLQTFCFLDKNAGNVAGECGIITDETILDGDKTPLRLTDGTVLPLTVRRIDCMEITQQTRCLTEADAQTAADLQLDEMQTALGVRQVLSCVQTYEIRENVLYAVRYISCIDDIASEEEFRIKTDS